MDLSKAFDTISHHLMEALVHTDSFDESLKFDLVTLETDFKG